MEVSLGRRVLIVETVWEQRGQANRVGSVRRQWLGVWPQPLSESTRSATARMQTEPCPQEGTLSPTEEEWTEQGLLCLAPTCRSTSCRIL